MYFYDTEDLLDRRDTLRISLHAMLEAYKEGLRGKDVVHAILRGKIIERYPARDRLLILGPAARFDLSLHVVCDYADREELVAVTVYIPDTSEWAAGRARRGRRSGHVC